MRRQLVESLVLLASNIKGRQYLRDIKVYPIVRALHTYIEENCRRPPVVPAVPGVDAALSSDLSIVAGGSGGQALNDGEEYPLCDDDEQTVEAVIKLVDYIMRKEDSADTASAATADAPSSDKGEFVMPEPEEPASKPKPKVVDVTEGDDSDDEGELSKDVD